MDETIKEQPRHRITSRFAAIVLIATSAVAWFHPAEAQPKKVPRIGFVSSSGGPNNFGPLVEAFRRGLRDLGYIEGKTFWLSFAPLKESWTVSQALWPNSSNAR